MSVFFCVTDAAGSGAAGAGAAGADAGAAGRPVGRLRRIVLRGAAVSRVGATPIASLREMREVLDFAAWLSEGRPSAMMPVLWSTAWAGIGPVTDLSEPVSFFAASIAAAGVVACAPPTESVGTDGALGPPRPGLWISGRLCAAEMPSIGCMRTVALSFADSSGCMRTVALSFADWSIVTFGGTAGLLSLSLIFGSSWKFYGCGGCLRRRGLPPPWP